MTSHDYRVLPAPRRGVKVRGARSPEERFAKAVEAEMNRMAAEGWDYLRSDILPCEERQGWFRGNATVYRTLLVFRRPVAAEAAATLPALDAAVPATAPAPLSALPEPWPEPFAEPRPAPRLEPRAPPRPAPEPRPALDPRPAPEPRPQPPRAMAPPLAPLPPRRTPPIAAPEAPLAGPPPSRTPLDQLLARPDPGAPRDPRLDRWAPDEP